jgi:hypothetical protein
MTIASLVVMILIAGQAAPPLTFGDRAAAEAAAQAYRVEDEGTGEPVAFTAARISAEQAKRIATGGTRPTLSGMGTSNLYHSDHVFELVAGRQDAINGCYQAAEFDEVNP